MKQNKTIKEYLSEKGIIYRENGKELITKCIFNNCDNDSASNEGHLYFNTETGQYDCKKCGEKFCLPVFCLMPLVGVSLKVLRTELPHHLMQLVAPVLHEFQPGFVYQV